MNAMIMITPVPLSTSRLFDGHAFVSSAPKTDSWLGNPDLALDGIILNKSDEQACLQTGEEWEPWWRHQLNERRTFTGIRLFPREGEPLANATVTISDPESGDEDFTIHIDHQNESMTYKIHPPRSGYRVELRLKRLKEKRTLIICEVEYVASSGNSRFSGELISKNRSSTSSYYFIRFKKNLVWLEAKRLCETENAHLLSINTRSEMGNIHEWLKGIQYRFWDDRRHVVQQAVYIGLSDQSEEMRGRVRGDNGFYRWEDGTPLTLTKWFAEQPDGSHREQCSMIRMFRRNIARLWHDVTCNQPLTNQYICEISK